MTDRHLQKALRCTELAMRQNPQASDLEYEDAALNLMLLSDDDLTQLEAEQDVQKRAQVRFEDLSIEAVQGLDAFRARMIRDLEGFWEGGVPYCRAKGASSGGHKLHVIVMGFLFAAGCSYKEALQGLCLAEQNDFWIETPASI